MTSPSIRTALSDQAHANRQIEVRPLAIGSEHLGGVASDGERKAAAVAQRKELTATKLSRRLGGMILVVRWYEDCG
jgi:hypothetical protein